MYEEAMIVQITDEKKYNEIIGERLRLIRKQRGLTQNDAAEAACLTQSALSDIEAGKRACPIFNAVKLIKLYRVKYDAVFGELKNAAETPEITAPSELDSAVKLLSALISGCRSQELIFTCSQSLAVSIYTVFRRIYRENPHNSEKLFGIKYEDLPKHTEGFAPESVITELERCIKHCSIKKELLELPVELNAELSSFIESSERILLAANPL